MRAQKKKSRKGPDHTWKMKSAWLVTWLHFGHHNGHHTVLGLFRSSRGRQFIIDFMHANTIRCCGDLSQFVQLAQGKKDERLVPNNHFSYVTAGCHHNNLWGRVVYNVVLEHFYDTASEILTWDEEGEPIAGAHGGFVGFKPRTRKSLTRSLKNYLVEDPFAGLAEPH